MDKERFDELVRRLASERNRRSIVTGMGGAVIASLGVSLSNAPADAADDEAGDEKQGGKSSRDKAGKTGKRKKSGAEAAAPASGKAGKGESAKAKGKKRGKGEHRNPGEYEHPGNPEIEGPCGNGSRKDNICTKNTECCTGICAVNLGKKNKDKKGRCRCVRIGYACTVDKNCCNSPCIGGICGALS